LVKITYKPWEEIVIREVIEYSLDEIIATQTVGVPTGQLSQPLLWAEGIVFRKSGMIPSPELAKENLEGRIHFNNISWTPMPDYENFIEISATKVRIPIVNVSANAILSEVAKWLKQSAKSLS